MKKNRDRPAGLWLIVKYRQLQQTYHNEKNKVLIVLSRVGAGGNGALSEEKTWIKYCFKYMCPAQLHRLGGCSIIAYMIQEILCYAFSSIR
jgi:hypothetical protein